MIDVKKKKKRKRPTPVRHTINQQTYKEGMEQIYQWSCSKKLGDKEVKMRQTDISTKI